MNLDLFSFTKYRIWIFRLYSLLASLFPTFPFYCDKPFCDESLCYWVFCHCNQNSCQEQLRGWKIYFGLMVSEIQSLVSWHYSGPEGRQSVMVEGYGGEKLLSSWHLGSKKRAPERSQEQDKIPKGMLPVTCFLQPCPTCLHLPSGSLFKLLIN